MRLLGAALHTPSAPCALTHIVHLRELRWVLDVNVAPLKGLWQGQGGCLDLLHCPEGLQRAVLLGRRRGQLGHWLRAPELVRLVQLLCCTSSTATAHGQVQLHLLAGTVHCRKGELLLLLLLLGASAAAASQGRGGATWSLCSCSGRGATPHAKATTLKVVVAATASQVVVCGGCSNRGLRWLRKLCCRCISCSTQLRGLATHGLQHLNLLLHQVSVVRHCEAWRKH